MTGGGTVGPQQSNLAASVTVGRIGLSVGVMLLGLVGCVREPEADLGDLRQFRGPTVGTTVVMRDDEMGVEAKISSEVIGETDALNVTERYVRIDTGEELARVSYLLEVTDQGLVQTDVNGKRAVLIASVGGVSRPRWPGVARVRAESEEDLKRGKVTRVSSTCVIDAVVPLQTLGVLRRTFTVRCDSDAGVDPAFTRTINYAEGLGLVGKTHTEQNADGSTFVGERWVLVRVE